LLHSPTFWQPDVATRDSTAAKIAGVKVLIIGGTIFLGPRLVEAALQRGHHVTTFSRGRHAGNVHAGVEVLKGDRNVDVSALRGRTWDAVIDTCGYVPGSIDRILDAVDYENLPHYTFVSSVSVYADFPVGGCDERHPVATITPEQLREAEEMTTGARASARTYGEMYGALKALCEQAAEHRMPGRVLNVRPGLIVGAHDYTDRFTYWVRRTAHGGTILAPGRPRRRVRVIDARDLAEWIVRVVDARAAGIFNATGAEDGLTFGAMLDAGRSVSASDARITWVDEQYLLDKGVQPWSELPLWMPEEHNGIFEVRNDRAIAHGLTFRPLSDTVRDTLAWDTARRQDEPLKAGLSRERERELLTHAPHPAH
jgi:2'-hydroxyisoflavone reductase